MGALACGVGCSHREATSRVQRGAKELGQVGDLAVGVVAEGAPDAAARGATRVLEWAFDSGRRAAVVVPAWGAPGERFPVVVALHGRGEALKPPADGALGWPRDYALPHAIDRVANPPLFAGDFAGFVERGHLAETNADLVRVPFGGVIVACPYLPDLNTRSTADLRAYARFILDELLPRVRRETPAFDSPEATGIDGVSLGGAVALRIGLMNPQAFGAVGALQPAISEADAPELTELARSARAQRPSLALRLTTSSGDYFRAGIARTSSAWRGAGVPHDYGDLPGPHDYVFNRGPGAIELLVWHDRKLVRPS